MHIPDSRPSTSLQSTPHNLHAASCHMLHFVDPQVQKTTMTAMTDERRLRLKVNSQGVVLSVSAGTPTSLFGMDPNKCVGMILDELVDVFAEHTKQGKLLQVLVMLNTR